MRSMRIFHNRVRSVKSDMVQGAMIADVDALPQYTGAMRETVQQILHPFCAQPCCRLIEDLEVVAHAGPTLDQVAQAERNSQTSALSFTAGQDIKLAHG